MNFIERIRLFFYKRFLQKKTSQHQRKHQPCNLDNARQVGILFDATELATQKVVQQYCKELQDRGKVVRTLGFINTRQKHENLSFPHFTRRDVDWAYRPKGTDVDHFMHQDFDILLVLSYHSNLQFEYISTLSKAQMRVGPYSENTDTYDLMLDASSQNDLRPFIDQIELYLTKIDSSHETPAA